MDDCVAGRCCLEAEVDEEEYCEGGTSTGPRMLSPLARVLEWVEVAGVVVVVVATDAGCGAGRAVGGVVSPLAVLDLGSTYSTCNVARLCFSSRCFAFSAGSTGWACLLMSPVGDPGCCDREGSLTDALRPSVGAV